jgi:hypothetical protein
VSEKLGELNGKDLNFGLVFFMRKGLSQIPIDPKMFTTEVVQVASDSGVFKLQ